MKESFLCNPIIDFRPWSQKCKPKSKRLGDTESAATCCSSDVWHRGQEICCTCWKYMKLLLEGSSPNWLDLVENFMLQHPQSAQCGPSIKSQRFHPELWFWLTPLTPCGRRSLFIGLGYTARSWTATGLPPWCLQHGSLVKNTFLIKRLNSGVQLWFHSCLCY